MGTVLLSIGVITMKIISSTSITSTIGVTLMSDTGGAAFFFCISIPPRKRAEDGRSCRPPAAAHSFNSHEPVLPVYSHPRLTAFEEVVDQLRAGVTHLHVKSVNAVGEVVEHP